MHKTPSAHHTYTHIHTDEGADINVPTYSEGDRAYLGKVAMARTDGAGWRMHLSRKGREKRKAAAAEAALAFCREAVRPQSYLIMQRSTAREEPERPRARARVIRTRTFSDSMATRSAGKASNVCVM